ncbi:hypothetical protein CGCVW01_v003400 [Colletotrichum viniferum]|nr:hypothetical protein CGCVW01_v003400 [Colletotrichum viniferum]
MVSLFTNSLTRLSGAGKLCTAMGIRLVTNTQVVHLAANGGFDALFIDLEHSTLSIQDASQHCIVGIQLGITPFVRVPYQCGNGFIQKVWMAERWVLSFLMFMVEVRLRRMMPSFSEDSHSPY